MLKRAVFNKAVRPVFSILRQFSTTSSPHNFPNLEPPKFRVSVIGAAGGIGQPLSLFLRPHHLIKTLSLYDVAPVTPGVATDLSHIPVQNSEVIGYTGDHMAESLKGADVVVVPAGVPRKPGMTRDDLFNTNAGIVANVAKNVALHCPKAQLLIISNPVNSTVPVAAEVLKRMNVYDPKRLYGVTTLDQYRAEQFVGKLLANRGGKQYFEVPVIGGHAGITILPLLSHVDAKFSQAEIEDLTKRIMFGGDEVVKAKGGAGSATLSMASAAAKFTDFVLSALNNRKTPLRPCAYVQSTICSDPEVTFFASPIKLGPEGIVEVMGPSVQLTEFEQQKMKEMLPELKDSIKKGVSFGKNYKL